VFYYAKIDFTPEQISISDEKHGSFVCLNRIRQKKRFQTSYNNELNSFIYELICSFGNG
jgi:hypothetical protein